MESTGDLLKRLDNGIDQRMRRYYVVGHRLYVLFPDWNLAWEISEAPMRKADLEVVRSGAMIGREEFVRRLRERKKYTTVPIGLESSGER